MRQVAELSDDAPVMVVLHAHPDDEAMLTGCLLAKAHALGWRTIVVYGTAGDAGTDHFELGSEALGQRRTGEAIAACSELGVARVLWLGYLDSGMAGSSTNARPDAFCAAAPEEVVDRLLTRLMPRRVDAVVGYDVNGLYGHPDHLQIHRVAHALAARLEDPYLIDATYHREYLAALPDSDGTLNASYATAEADLTHFVQGERWFRAKMEAVKRHESQVPHGHRTSAGTGRGIARWRTRYGTEWFIVRPPERTEVADRLTALFDPKPHWPGPLAATPPVDAASSVDQAPGS